MNFPVKLIHPRGKPDRDGKRKELTARNQAELDRLLKIGWKLKPGETVQ